MSDAEDLACRYLHIWQDYLTALMVDLRESRFLEFWIAACSALARDPLPRDPAAVEQTWPPGSSPSAAPAASASGEHDDVMADLVGRLARVDDRLAALERIGQAAARPRGRNRRARD
jgi:hypothetical protein